MSAPRSSTLARPATRAPFLRNALRRSALGAMVLACGPARAADAKPADPDLPRPVDAEVGKALLENPPFTRMIDLSDTLKLTGLAYVQGKPVATLVNRQTKQTYLVTEAPNALGWKLAGVSSSPQLKQTEVRIMIGGEITSLRYGETQTKPGGKTYMPSKIPTPEEFTGHDEKGAYVRGFAYLTDDDRERFRRTISREVREKFLNIVHDQRDAMFKASHEERAAMVKKALDAAEGRDRTP